MGSATGQVCFLSRVIGDFDGGGEHVDVSISGGRWWLSGASGTSHTIGATAFCRPLDPSTSVSSEFTWTKGGSAVNLPDNGSCFLTRVKGAFNGGGEQVRTFKDDSGNWWLDGTSGASGTLSASVRCVAGETIVANNSWDQGNARTILITGDERFTTRACFLQGMRGQFEGGGEYIMTYHDPDVDYFYVTGDSGQFSVKAWAGCIQ